MAVTSAPAPATARRPGAPIPRIRRGEIKNVASYRSALRQLATRPDVEGNTALVLYDDGGNLHLQVFGRSTDGVRRLAYDGAIGRVPVPGGVRPGTAPFGNALEPLILAQLARLTGQRFRSKRANAGGPDIDAYETGGAGVALDGLCIQAHRIAQAIRTRRGAAERMQEPQRSLVIAGARRRGAEWLARVVRQLERVLGSIPRERIDLLVGCLARVEHAMGTSSGSLERLRRAAAGRIGGGIA